MRRWDELHQQERQLSYQLEEVSHRRFRAERILDDIEIYMSNNQSLEMELYEATYQSKYANQLEETSHQLNVYKNNFFNDFDDCITTLKAEERRLEDKMDVIYYEKLKESCKEEEKK